MPINDQPTNLPESPERKNGQNAVYERVEADVVNIEQGAAQNVQAKTVTVTQGGIQTVTAERVEIHQGGIAQVQAHEVSVQQGGLALAQADHLRLSHVRAGAVFGRQVHSENSRTFLLAAQQIDGTVEATLDTGAAIALGAAAGVVFGLFLLLIGLITKSLTASKNN
jgi:hypothetical protein